MSLNNIRITTQLLTQLYAHSLLQTERSAQDKKGIEVAELETSVSEVADPPPTPRLPATEQKNAPPIVKPTVTEMAAKENIAHLGGNAKGVLILVANDSAPFLPDGELEFLSAILGACKLSIADVAIVNLQHRQQTYTQLVQQFNSKQVLLMGVATEQIDLPFHFPHFQLQQFDGRTYLSAQRLAEMADDKEAKMQLWKCLKAMFGV